MNKKVALITGASSGIGKALAYTFASQNFNLVLAARRIELLNHIANDLKDKFNVEVIAVKTDVSIEEDAKNFVNIAAEKFDRIDVLINNAGISQRSIFSNTNLDVIKKVMSVNYWGAVFCTKYALPYLDKSKGSVIAISSISGYTPLPARTAYASSKYALHGFMESLRLEYLNKGVHVLVATPSFTASEIRINALTENGNPQGFTPKDESKLMTAEYVAEKVFIAYKRKKRTLILPKIMGFLFIKFIQLFPNWSDRFIYSQMKKEEKTPIE